jgi:hypothetical protein
MENSSSDYLNFIQNYEINLEISENFLKISQKFNCLSCFVIIVFGLLSNMLGIVFFMKKRFLTNSIHVYLLCLAVNDSLFLMTHFLEVN